MQLLLYGLVALLIAAVDQISKYFTVTYIQLYEQVELLPGFIGLTYVRNTGAAYSSFEGMRWFFVLVFLLFSVAIAVNFVKKYMPFTKFETWCIVAIYGGGLGNVIDRIWRGYVVDMIRTEFIDFPIFNVADCFITCGCIALIISLIFFNKAFWKDEKK